MSVTYNFLIEQTSVVNSDSIQILAEEKLLDGNSKLVFKNRLQEANVRNNNRRIYPMTVCESIVEQLGPKANARALLMEVDHPLFVSTDPNILKKRAGIVEINNCGALLRKVYLDGNQIIGEAETLSGFKGPDIANLISRDKVDMGFSLRALGAVESLHDGTLQVKTPIRPITYDLVSNPSHTNAKIMEFLPESAQEFGGSNQSVICEVGELEMLQEENIQVFEGVSSVARFVDDIINEQFVDIISSKITFFL